MAERGPGAQAAAIIGTVVAVIATMALMLPMGAVHAQGYLDAHRDHVDAWAAVILAAHLAIPALFAAFLGLRPIDASGAVPVPAISGRGWRRVPAMLFGVVVLLAVGADLMVILGDEDAISEQFPRLGVAVFAGVGLALVVGLVLTMLLGALPAGISARRLERTPGEVTGVAEVGGAARHAVRVIMKPGLLGGAVGTLLLEGVPVSPLSPGQAVGLVGTKDVWELGVAPRVGGGGAALHARARVELLPHESATVVFRAHHRRAPRIEIHGSPVTFHTSERPFTARFAGGGAPQRRGVGPGPVAERAKPTAGIPGIPVDAVSPRTTTEPHGALVGARQAHDAAATGAKALVVGTATWLGAVVAGSAVTLALGLTSSFESAGPAFLGIAAGAVIASFGLDSEIRRVRLRAPLRWAPGGLVALGVGGAVTGVVAELSGMAAGDIPVLGAAGVATAATTGLLLIGHLSSAAKGNNDLVKSYRHVRAWRARPADATDVAGPVGAGAAVRFLSIHAPDEIAVEVAHEVAFLYGYEAVPAYRIEPGVHVVQVRGRATSVTSVPILAVAGHTTTVMVGLTPPRLLWVLPNKRRAIARFEPPAPGLPG